jgi:hypothetical protein
MSGSDPLPEVRSPGLAEIPIEEIREALDRVLESPELRTSRRSQEFLRFVVETALAGNAQALKERTIGVEVFGRAASYDPGNDSTVRVKAGEVRKRLHAYYTGSGAGSPIRIELPQGGYQPEFRRVVEAPLEPVPIVPDLPRRRSRLKPVLAGLAAVGLVGMGFLLAKPAPARIDPALRQFWGPALDSSNATLLCLSYVPVYGLDPELERWRLKPRKAEDLTLLTDEFVGGGDLLATASLFRLFAGMGHDYRLKVGSDLSFRDLRSSPAVLVGYSYTRWSSLLGGLRYLLDTNPAAPGVTDYGKPTAWVLHPMPRDRKADEDYALVCRLFQPDTGTLVVLLSGITQYGTESAADLVSSPARLREAVRTLPAGWTKRNVQLVLHTRVISGEAAAPRVVASHVW